MPNSFAPPSVVVVNDDDDQLALITRVLEEASLRVVACRSVNEAMQCMRQQKPALIITDLYMPDIDGWAFCRMLRSAACREFNRTPILVVSATFTMSNANEVAAELGATSFLSIPIDAVRLRERVRDLIANPVIPAEWNVLLALNSGPELADVQAVFGASGCNISTVDSVAEASQALTSEEWETVVCDLDLPGCTLEQVGRWTAAAPHAAFVVVTQNPAPDAAVNSLRAGAAAHLRRPFAPDYLFGLCELARQKNVLIRAQRLLERRTIELHNSEHLMQMLLDSSDQIYLVTDRELRIRLANTAAREIWTEMFEGSIGEGESVLDRLPEPMRRQVADSLALALGGQVVQHDTEVTNRHGRLRRFNVRYTPLKADDGQIGRVCFNAHDITVRSEVENALRLRNEALSSISQGVLIADVQRRITYANDSFLAITGYQRWDVMGKSCGFIQGEHTDPEVRTSIKSKLDAGEAFHGEILNYRKDGQTFWNDLSITPVKDMDGHVTQFVGVIRDVTTRRNREEQLHASQARLQALFDHSNDAILLADDQGCYVDVNPAACRMLGYTRRELIGLHSRSIFAEGDRSWAEGAWAEFLTRGTQGGECKLRRRDGSTLRADYSGIAHILPGLHLSILRDMSERYALQGQLLRQQRLESVGRLASGVAHDLNNILTPILMTPSMLRPHVADAGARMLLDKLESGARRGSSIVHQLLAFARGKPGEKSRIDLSHVLRDASAIIRETFPKNISLEAIPAFGDFSVLGDANQLQQVLLNLAINSADAMSRGGRLVIGLELLEIDSAEAARDPEVRPGQHAVLTVADHGDGITPENIDKIFDPFFTTKPFGQGSGLGLSVVLGIVRDHGGFIRVSSRVGIGSIFRVHIPYMSDRPAIPSLSSTPFASVGRPTGAGRTILIVDDEADVRDIVRLILSREGYRVMCADGADAAFSQLQACGGRVDLVITDMAMPGVSGSQFVELLRSRRADMPILVMTGLTTDNILPPHVRALVCGVLPKPFEAVSLLSAVTNSLQGLPV
jgi:two-component system, cell cycle sensor histidine kinase and response regulator CckA